MPYGRLHTAIRYRSVISITVMAAVWKMEANGLSGLEMEEDQAEETGLAETDTVSEETTTVSREELESKMDEEFMPDLLESANPLEAAKMYEILLCDRTRGKQYREQRKFRSCIYRKNSSRKNDQPGKIHRTAVRPRAVSKETRVVKAAQSKLQCPGHVDLHITVYITGYDENNNLFAVDPIGGKEEKPERKLG